MPGAIQSSALWYFEYLHHADTSLGDGDVCAMGIGGEMDIVLRLFSIVGVV